MKRRLRGLFIGAAVGAMGGIAALAYMQRNRPIQSVSMFLVMATAMAVIGGLLGAISGVSIEF